MTIVGGDQLDGSASSQSSAYRAAPPFNPVGNQCAPIRKCSNVCMLRALRGCINNAPCCRNLAGPAVHRKYVQRVASADGMFQGICPHPPILDGLVHLERNAWYRAARSDGDEEQHEEEHQGHQAHENNTLLQT